VLSRLLRYDSEPTPTERAQRADDTGRRRGGETGRACPCSYFGKHGASASFPFRHSRYKIVTNPFRPRFCRFGLHYRGFVAVVRKPKTVIMKTNERTVDWPPARRASLHSIADTPAGARLAGAPPTPPPAREPGWRRGTGSGTGHSRTPAARPRTTAARPPRTTAARHTRTRDVPARARRATPRMGPDTRSGYRVPRTQRRCRLRPTRLQGTRTAPRTV